MSTVTNRVVTTKDWQSGSLSPWEIGIAVVVGLYLLRGFSAQATANVNPDQGTADAELEWGAPGIPGIPAIPGY